ncbi:hypothetical protein F8388_009601 [Cannabis sativa]|uniref:RNase H type-1 domain-containing protein n=1 Tax=Cannabis sativa TaxID=3483 RepID=A0A7J6E9V4_CANSA|nr:hypothetical protein F8388_009601 [Cannabis sativa]
MLSCDRPENRQQAEAKLQPTMQWAIDSASRLHRGQDESMGTTQHFYYIWNTRNSILFKKNLTTNNVEEFVEYKDAQHSQQHDSQPSEDSNIPQSSHQLRPPSLSPETPALFVDAATDHLKSLTGAGFVFKRGHQTVLASNFSRLPGVVSPIFSEGQALLQSLNWCIDSQFTPQVVFSDCLNLVSKVNGDWQDNSALSAPAQPNMSKSEFNFLNLGMLHII